MEQSIGSMSATLTNPRQGDWQVEAGDKFDGFFVERAVAEQDDLLRDQWTGHPGIETLKALTNANLYSEISAFASRFIHTANWDASACKRFCATTS